MTNFRLLITLAAASIAISCSDQNSGDSPLGSYDNGILVLNEGGAGTMTFISNDLQTVQQDIFTVVNPSQDLGQFAQSVFFDQERAFIISNGSNKITVVNRYTMEFIATLSTGFSVPRYGVVTGGKAFVTNLGDFGTSADDYLAVINLGDLSMASPIAIGNYAERIALAGNRLFVANGAFGSGNSITVVDPSTGSIVKVIETGIAPNSLEAREGILYVLCAAFGEPSKLIRIELDDLEIIDQVEFPATLAGASNLDVEGPNAYFSVGPKVYKIDVDATVVTDSPLFDTGSDSDYIGYGFAVNAGRVYISEAAEDFSSDGKIFVYSTDGSFIDQFPVGLGPNGFYFN